jgi:hypothetical protein
MKVLGHPWRLVPTVTTLSLLLGGCAPADASPAATFEDGVEHMPPPASVRLVGESPAPRDMVVAFVTDQGDVLEEQQTRVARGDSIEAGVTSGRGRLRATVDGTVCLGWLDLVDNMTTVARLRLTADGCEVSPLRLEPNP